MHHSGPVAVSGLAARRERAAWSIAEATRGASSRANNTPSSRHSLQVHQQRSHRLTQTLPIFSFFRSPNTTSSAYPGIPFLIHSGLDGESAPRFLSMARWRDSSAAVTKVI